MTRRRASRGDELRHKGERQPVLALLVMILVLMIGTMALGVAELYRQAELAMKADKVAIALAHETALRADQAARQGRFNARLIRGLGRQGKIASRLLRDILRELGFSSGEISDLLDAAAAGMGGPGLPSQPPGPGPGQPPDGGPPKPGPQPGPGPGPGPPGPSPSPTDGGDPDDDPPLICAPTPVGCVPLPVLVAILLAMESDV